MHQHSLVGNVLLVWAIGVGYCSGVSGGGGGASVSPLASAVGRAGLSPLASAVLSTFCTIFPYH